jgi:predicted enzyme related to lactoylglutathione lyase
VARIKHIEFAGTDGAALREFYGALFDWPISRRESAGFDYYDVNAGGDVTTGIRHEPEGCAEIVVYVEVENVGQAVERARELGARVRIPPMAHGQLVFALIEDPQGNPVGLTQAARDA